MAEPADWVLVVAALVATAVTVLPRTGHRGARMIQAMGFLLLGTVASLIWLRLGSVDVALAEAALGSGLLGAVLVYVAAAPQRRDLPSVPGEGLFGTRRWVAPLTGVVAGAVLMVVLSAVWLRIEQTMPGWSRPLEGLMPLGEESGSAVEHGVTAVLLAFRAYDTLLESAVLMIAALAALALRTQAPVEGGSASAAGPEGQPVSARTQPAGLGWLVRVIAPVLLLAGLWLLFAGSTDSGGAFQSGAVLAAMLILLRTAGLSPGWLARPAQDLLLRVALVAGVVVFILAGLLGPLRGLPWLSWDSVPAFAVILTVEILLTVGIAVGLYAVYLSLEGSRTVRR